MHKTLEHNLIIKKYTPYIHTVIVLKTAREFLVYV